MTVCLHAPCTCTHGRSKTAQPARDVWHGLAAQGDQGLCCNFPGPPPVGPADDQLPAAVLQCLRQHGTYLERAPVAAAKQVRRIVRRLWQAEYQTDTLQGKQNAKGLKVRGGHSARVLMPTMMSCDKGSRWCLSKHLHIGEISSRRPSLINIVGQQIVKRSSWLCCR